MKKEDNEIINPIFSASPPPNYKQLQQAFPKADFEKGIVYVYGDTIHTKFPIPDHLRVHELVHIKQQKIVGGPEIWWDRYIHDRVFRLQQEIEAMSAEYSFITRHYPPRSHFDHLRYLAESLVSYYDLGIGYFRAVDLIRDSTKPIHI